MSHVTPEAVADVVRQAGGTVVTSQHGLSLALSCAADETVERLAAAGIQVLVDERERWTLRVVDAEPETQIEKVQPEPRVPPADIDGGRVSRPDGNTRAAPGQDGPEHVPLAELGLSARSYNALMRAGITTEWALRTRSDEELLAIMNLGQNCLCEIRAVLAARPASPPDPKAEEPSADRSPELMHIAELELHVRSFNSLMRAKIVTVGDLLRWTPEDLLSLPNFGVTSLGDVEAALENVGLPLGGVSSRDRASRREAVEELPPLALGTTSKAFSEFLSSGQSDQAIDLAIRYQSLLATEEEAGVSLLQSLLVKAVDLAGARGVLMLDLRETQTLAELGRMFGVTRERIRQIESQAQKGLAKPSFVDDPALVDLTKRLSGRIVSDRDVNDALGGSAALFGTHFAAVVMKALGFEPPHGFGGRIRGFWTDQPMRLVRSVETIAAELPFGDGRLPELMGNLGLSGDFPLVDVLSEPSSPVRFHAPLKVWVRPSATQRDAAWLLLRKHRKPATADALAELLEMKANALRESLRRDSRFGQLRPSGEWTLKEWGDEGTPKYGSTLEAALSVLRDRGPIDYPSYEDEVIRRYPVSTAAVKQTLLSAEIGRWPDGCLDLVERGATPAQEPEPRQPPNVTVDKQGKELRLYIDVDADVVRGSGTGVSPYVTWWAGLRNAPTKRTFRARSGEIVLSRNLGGASISTIREVVNLLGGDLGCRVCVSFRSDKGTAHVSLACEEHEH